MNYAIILSGGTGSRIKNIEIPKQYYMVNQKPIFTYSLKTIAELKMIDRFIIVAAEDWQSFILQYIDEYLDKFSGFAAPGENRQLSIYNGMKIIQETAAAEDIILVHDAARPLVTVQLLEACIKGAQNADGAMPVLQVKDTVYYSQDGKSINSLLDRGHVYAGQAPEAFCYQKYLAANQALIPNEILKINGSSEVAYKMGMNIQLIDGDENNFKITTDADLKRFQYMIDGDS